MPLPTLTPHNLAAPHRVRPIGGVDADAPGAQAVA